MTVPRCPAPTPCTILLLLAAGALSSCASVCVRPATGPQDVGVHYYMPKPYVKVSKSVAKDTPVKYDAEVIYLPDPNERRTIVERPGFGTARMTAKLANGWMLTDTSADHVGADPSEFLTAATGLAKLVLELSPRSVGVAESQPETKEIIAVLFGVNMHRSVGDPLFDERILIFADGTSETDGGTQR
jgi:hypothetical protein